MSTKWLAWFVLSVSVLAAPCGWSEDRESDPTDGPMGRPVPSPTHPRPSPGKSSRLPNDAIVARDIKSMKQQASDGPGKSWNNGSAKAPPIPATSRNGLLDRWVNLEHVEWNSSYFLFVPSTYRPNVPHPLLVIMNGGNANMSVNKARNISIHYLQPWIELAEERGWILASPAAAKGWGAMATHWGSA